MSADKGNSLATQTLSNETMLALVAGGDTSKLSDAQRLAYYTARCEAAGLDPRTQPFEFIRFQGREIIYAKKAAADQLAAKHGIKASILSQVTEDGIRVVTVRAEARDGRATEDVGALPVKGLNGVDLSNALMKCVTKAKRRTILSLCGLGMLDEIEIEEMAGPRFAAPPIALPVPAVMAPVASSSPQPEPAAGPETPTLAQRIRAAKTRPELEALIAEIKRQAKTAQEDLRPVYQAKAKELGT